MKKNNGDPVKDTSKYEYALKALGLVVLDLLDAINDGNSPSPLELGARVRKSMLNIEREEENHCFDDRFELEGVLNSYL